MKIALDNAKCRRDPNFKPSDLKDYPGFGETNIQAALGRFKKKMKALRDQRGVNEPLTRESSTTSDLTEESATDEPTCMEKTWTGIVRCWTAFSMGFGKCMGLDDDAFAVSD